LLAFVSAIIIALGYVSWNASIRRDQSELPRYGSAPDFDLTDQNGMPMSKERLRGKTWVADFFYVADPDANALLSSRFAELDQNFQKGEQLILVSFVIPKDDLSGPNLSNLSRRYLASSHWHFLAGTADGIRKVEDRWKQIASVQADGRVVSRTLFLIDSGGAVRGIYDGTSPEAVQRVLGDIGTLLRTGVK
jgi:protein SCO1/2